MAGTQGTKRQMYLMSTEKAVKLGERKDLKSSMSSYGGAAAQCQKCFQTGHWTYECKNERIYISHPSQTQQLKNPKLKTKLSVSYELDNPDIPKQERGEQSSSSKSKRKHRSDSDSGSSTCEASGFETDCGSSMTGSEYSSGESSSSGNGSSSNSEEERRRRRKKKKQQKKRHRRYSSSYSNSESDTASDSDSDYKTSRRKSRRHHERKHWGQHENGAILPCGV